MTVIFPASWLPQAASTGAHAVDVPFQALYVLTTFSVVLVVGLAVAYVRLFGRRGEDDRGRGTGEPNRLLLGLWVLGAAGLAVFAVAAGLPGFIAQTVPPYGAYPVGVTARTGAFTFEYPGGHAVDTLHVEVGRPVVLNMTSTDVVHGLSVPALRLHQAVLPGRTTRAWFEATTADTFALRDDVFSGDSLLVASTALVALEAPEYQRWLNSIADIFIGRTPVEVGELLYNRQGCKACHTLDGTRLVGPSFKDLYGHQAELRDGSRVVIDDAYIHESILYPNRKVVAGYEPVMTPFLGKLNDKEIGAITAWLRTLSSLGETGDEAAAAADSSGGSRKEK